MLFRSPVRRNYWSGDFQPAGTDYRGDGRFACSTFRTTLLQSGNDLQLVGSVEETAKIAGSVDSTEGVYLVPAFSGLGAPYWNHRARAMISGMSFRTRKAHVVRAALESIAYQVKDLVDLMKEGAGIDDIELRVDGGLVKNDFLMKFQSAIIGGRINRSFTSEGSALGVALAAGLSADWWETTDELESLRSGEVIESSMPPEVVADLYRGWKNAVRQVVEGGAF